MKKIFTHILFLAVLLMGAIPAHAAVQINSTSFPDEAFRTLVQKFDTSKDGTLSDSEINAVTEIDCEKNTSIKDVTGIAYFTSLKSLSVWKCPLSKLNVSQNRQLEYLDCCETGISALNVASNPNIHQLWCYGNHFTELDLTNNYYLVKAYSKGIYKNDTYISYADDETESYLALDKTVKLKLPPGTSVSNPQTPAESSGTSASDPQTPSSDPGTFVGVGETARFDNEVTIPGAFLDEAFKVDCTDIVSITQARTGNIKYADAVTYYFTIWITGKKPGTTKVTVYDNSKTKQIWSTTITVYGDDPEADEPKEQQGGTKPSETQPQTTDGSQPVSGSTKQAVPKVGTKLTHSGSGLIYVVSRKGKEVSLKGVSGKKKIIKVPQTVTLKGIKYDVTAISAGAFKGNRSIQNVAIANSIKIIGSKAFSGCTALKKIKIGNGVTAVKSRAFYGCKKLTGVTFGSKVSSVGAGAFSGCRSLQKIVLPASVRSIGKEAFLNCTKLSGITIKTAKLTSGKVGKNAFKGISAKAVLKVPAKSRKSYTAFLKKKGLPAKAKIK